MKRLSFIFASIFLLSVAIANGQVFVGGNIGLTTTGGSTSSNGVSIDKPTTTSFSFSPMGGYFLSDKFAVGLGISFLSDRVKTPGNQDVTDVTKTFGLTPFVRYYVYKINKFSVFGTGYLDLGWGSQKTTTGDVSVDGPSTTSFGFGVYPGISYDLSNKISLEANINLLSLGYNYSVQKQTVNDTETKDATSGFSFGAGINNIATTGSITIGAIIKF